MVRIGYLKGIMAIKNRSSRLKGTHDIFWRIFYENFKDSLMVNTVRGIQKMAKSIGVLVR